MIEDVPDNDFKPAVSQLSKPNLVFAVRDPSHGQRRDVVEELATQMWLNIEENKDISENQSQDAVHFMKPVELGVEPKEVDLNSGNDTEKKPLESKPDQLNQRNVISYNSNV